MIASATTSAGDEAFMVLLISTYIISMMMAIVFVRCQMSMIIDHLCSVLLYDDNDDNTLNANCDPDMRPASGWRGS